MAFDGGTPAEVSRADPHGTVTLTYSGHTLPVRFSWGALAGLQAAWGEDWLEKAANALERKQVQDVAEMLSFASNYSLADVMEISAPLNATVEALTVAWQVAWLGHNFEQWDKEDEPEPEAEGKPQAPVTWWGRLAQRLSSLASHGANSTS